MANRPESKFVELKGFRRTLGRQVTRLAAYFDEGTTKKYPKTSDAIGRLREAVAAEINQRNRASPTHPEKPTRPNKKRKQAPGPSRKHYMRCVRLKCENDQLKAKLTNHKAAMPVGNQISPAWIVKIFLTSPGQNARGLTKSFRDIIGVDKNPVSRETINKIRGAWCEFYKKIVMKLAADRVAHAVAAATSRRVAFAPVYFVHVQDEADIRLRSGDGFVSDMPGRSRASKVQQHVVELGTNFGTLEIPTEMEALGDKTAATLCTSFERLVRSFAADVFPATHVGAKPQASVPAKPQASVPAKPQASVLAKPQASVPAKPQASVLGKPQADIWLFHILVGDGIATNDAAAKRLWACLQERGLGPRVRYFLLVIVCGTHQVGLTAKAAVTGRAAAAAARGLLHEDIAGVTVRLFKYLINDYFEEFVFSINEWVFRDLEILMPDEADIAGQASPLSWRGKHHVGGSLATPGLRAFFLMDGRGRTLPIFSPSRFSLYPPGGYK
jgi:hypothetical protein